MAKTKTQPAAPSDALVMELCTMLTQVLECSELNADELEEETEGLVDAAWGLLHRLSPPEA